MNRSSKYDTESKCDYFSLYLSGFSFLAGISTYLLMYFKYVKNRRPSVIIPVERWVTVNPFLTIMIVVCYIASLILFIIALWPVYKFTGFIFGILIFLSFNILAQSSPI